MTQKNFFDAKEFVEIMNIFGQPFFFPYSRVWIKKCKYLLHVSEVNTQIGFMVSPNSFLIKNWLPVAFIENEFTGKLNVNIIDSIFETSLTLEIFAPKLLHLENKTWFNNGHQAS